MNSQQLTETYLQKLAEGDLDGVLALFSPDAIVHSPLYGSLPASEFYPKLAGDTRASHLSFTDLFHSSQDAQTVALRFTYRWDLANGQQKTFDCIDIFRLNDQHQITELTIIYDTHPRPI